MYQSTANSQSVAQQSYTSSSTSPLMAYVPPLLLIFLWYLKFDSNGNPTLFAASSANQLAQENRCYISVCFGYIGYHSLHLAMRLLSLRTTFPGKNNDVVRSRSHCLIPRC